MNYKSLLISADLVLIATYAFLGTRLYQHKKYAATMLFLLNVFMLLLSINLRLIKLSFESYGFELYNLLLFIPDALKLGMLIISGIILFLEKKSELITQPNIEKRLAWIIQPKIKTIVLIAIIGTLLVSFLSGEVDFIELFGGWYLFKKISTFFISFFSLIFVPLFILTRVGKKLFSSRWTAAGLILLPVLSLITFYTTLSLVFLTPYGDDLSDGHPIPGGFILLLYGSIIHGILALVYAGLILIIKIKNKK